MSNDTTTPKNTFSYEVPKQLENIDIEHEKFNSTELSGAAGRLDSAFSQFASILQAANDLVNEHVNASCDECVFGSYGNQLLEMWNSNVPTFNEFKTNFESWSRAVSVISTRNENTENIANAIYNNRTTGADLTTAGGQTVSEIREDIILKAADEFGGTNSRDGKTYKYYDENGKLITRYENADGEVWMQHTSDNNDRLVSTVCTDKDENTSKIEFVRDENGKVIDKKVTFYDKDGNELETPPETFNENGYLSNGTPKTEPVQAAEPIQATEPIQDTEPVQNTEPVQATEPVEGNGAHNTSVTVSSGQQVTINGTNYNYLMSSDGKNYYTLSNDPNAQVYVDGENGPEIYVGYDNTTYTRNSFVSERKNYTNVGWSVTYNDGSSPFDSVGSADTVTFDGISSNTSGNSFVYSDPGVVHDNAVPLESINFGEVSLGNEKLPDVIYVAPGDDIRWDPTDFLDLKDIHIEGGDSGKYLVLDPNSNTYYTMDSSGTFLADGGDDLDFSAISAERLLSSNTKISTK